jgi:NADH:ubiquinone oxidoreductase subunit F (NADH-binding)
MPRQQPPYPEQAGINGLPTLLHDAETIGSLPWIMVNGGESFAEIGTPNSTGTKIIAIGGDVRNKTLIEIPFGTTLRRITDELGQGLSVGGGIKALHIGGPLGGVIPGNLLETPFDYEALNGLGTTPGSGRITVLGDKTCLACYSHQVLTFLAGEACGGCVPCRVGTKRNATVLGGIVSKLGKMEDLELVAELAGYQRDAAICSFGAQAPRVMISSIGYFPEDFRQHIEAGSCPAGPCPPPRQYRYQRRAVL